MTFPVVEATNTSVESTAVTSHDVSLPASISVGELLLAILGSNADFGGVTPPGGWSEVHDVTATALEKRTADGSEGASAAFTSVNSVVSVHNSYRISGQHGDVEIATTSSTSDPPSLTPSWGAEDTLWIAGLLIVGISPTDVTAAPANYGGLIKSAEVVSGSSALIATATRQLNAVSEDPGAFTTSGIVLAGVAFTIAVRPAGGGGDPRSIAAIMG